MKNDLFRRVAASFLTLTMLAPCLMVVPASAAEETAAAPISAAAESAAPDLLYQFIPVRQSNDTKSISSNLFFDETATLSDVRKSSSHYMHTDDGVKAMKCMVLYNQTSSAKNYGLPGHYIGSKWTEDENLKLTIEDMEPIVVGEHEVINLDLHYGFRPSTHTTNSAFSCVMRVYVSIDGETFLEDYAKVRWTELLGVGNSSKSLGGNDVFYYRICSENLLDIEGLKEGDTIYKIQIWPDGAHSDTYSNAYFYGIDVNGYKTVKDFETAVPQFETMQMDPELLREIVVTEGQDTATLYWKTDNTIHTVNNGSVGERGQHYLAGVQYRGGVYERDCDVGREEMEESYVNGWHTSGYTNQTAFGMDCATFVMNAATRVSRGYLWSCQSTFQESCNTTISPLLKHDERVEYSDAQVLDLNTQQEMYAAYAAAGRGDIFLSYAVRGGEHTRLLVDQTVVYNEDGTINPTQSKARFTEQAATVRYDFLMPDGTQKRITALYPEDMLKFQVANPDAKLLYGFSAGADLEWTYKELWDGLYVPLALNECLTGIVEKTRSEIIVVPKNGTDITEDGVVIGMATNYLHRYVVVRVTDLNQGIDVFYEKRYPDVPRMTAHSFKSEQLDELLRTLKNGDYRLSIDLCAGLVTTPGGDSPITNKTIDFTIEGRSNENQVELQSANFASKGDKIVVAVNVNKGFDTADVEVKFDTDLLTYENGVVLTANAFKAITRDKGILRITAAAAGSTRGSQLAELTFTAKADIADMSEVLQIKSAMTSTADKANTANMARSIVSSDITPSLAMGDVNNSSWFRQAADYVLGNGLMSGYDSSTFGPNNTLTRAQMVQILYNKENTPELFVPNTFSDVDAKQWYCDAVRWGADKGVVSGYGNGTFGPADKVTLEQVAVILWNYAGKPAASASADTFGAHDSWADQALSWCADKGIMKDVPYTTVTGAATRAQTAQMLMNYLEQ